MTTAAEWLRDGSTAPTGSTAGVCIKSLDKVRLYLRAGEATADPAGGASCSTAQVAEATPAADAIILTTPDATAG